MARAIALSVVLSLIVVLPAAAQTTLTASPAIVAAGAPATFTVSGPPGHFVAVGASSVGAGLSFGGVNLSLGSDVDVIVTLQLDGTGHGSFAFAPPFYGTVLDRFYVQAVSSPSPSFIPATPSNSVVIRNADTVGVAVGGDVVGTLPNLTLAPGARESIVNAINSGGPINFTGGISADNQPVTNVGLPAAPTDAVNKAYTDANFIKFVPGGEQLSIGDANGTAAMIDLRGGSTCCGGPGGHTPAFFKVFQNGSFLFTGNLGIGVSPLEGKGYRTSWHAYKGAFRSGYADNEWDDANTGFFSWAGGSNSTASGLYSFAFGDSNFARSTSSIAFGSGNEAKGAGSFTAGAGNRVCDAYGVAFGNKAQSGGPLVSGRCDPDSFNITGLAAVAIGYNVTADKDHTTAMGKFASNNGFSGTFAWSDGAATSSTGTFRNTANNEFAARASGGFRFRTNLAGTTGCNLPAGSGVFTCTSSRTTKENFDAVNGEDLLSRLRRVPMSTWNYITEGQAVRHLGPMAEDFHQAFSLGTDDTSIGVQDLASVSLAAVQALEARTRTLTSENDALRAETAALRAELEAIKAVLLKR